MSDDPADIFVVPADGRLHFRAPVPEAKSMLYLNELRKLPGRRWNAEDKANSVPEAERRALWAFLRRWHRGRTIQTPKGRMTIS